VEICFLKHYVQVRNNFCQVIIIYIICMVILKRSLLISKLDQNDFYSEKMNPN
jgi:hypothetical protein